MCKLCGNYATNEHVNSKKHRWRALHPGAYGIDIRADIEPAQPLTMEDTGCSDGSPSQWQKPVFNPGLVCETATALRSVEAAADGYLSLSEGDCITIQYNGFLERDDAGWHYGRSDSGMSGWLSSHNIKFD